MKSSTETIIGALRVLARDIQTDDGVINACLEEAAERLEELSAWTEIENRGGEEMKPYETRVLSLIVLPEEESIFSEMATTITIEDEAGGEFVIIEQPGLADVGKIRIDPVEWTAIRAAIDRMIGECRPLHPTDHSPLDPHQ